MEGKIADMQYAMVWAILRVQSAVAWARALTRLWAVGVLSVSMGPAVGTPCALALAILQPLYAMEQVFALLQMCACVMQVTMESSVSLRNAEAFQILRQVSAMGMASAQRPISANASKETTLATCVGMLSALTLPQTRFVPVRMAMVRVLRQIGATARQDGLARNASIPSASAIQQMASRMAPYAVDMERAQHQIHASVRPWSGLAGTALGKSST
jgi:hypothetical protein